MGLNDTLTSLSSFLNSLVTRVDHPEAGWNAWRRRFLVNLVLAILAAGDLVLSKVVRAMPGPRATIGKRYERIDRMLGDIDLVTVAAEQTAYLGQRVGNGWVIALDLSDISKKYARHMEALAKVRDGSEGTFGPGYGLVTASAVDLTRVERGFPLPLLFEVFSSAEEDFKSEPAIWLEAIERLCDATPKGATITIDRAADNGRILGRLLRWDRSFVVRIKCGETSRTVLVDGDKRSVVRDAWKEGRLHGEIEATRITEKGERKPYRAEVRSLCVRLPEHPRRELWLAVFDSPDHKQPMVLLTTHRVESLDDGAKVLAMYFARWVSEEMHRFAKQAFGLEHVRTLTWHRTRNLVAATWMAMGAMAVQALKPRAELILRHLEIVSQRLEEPLTTRQFWGYAWADGLGALLRGAPGVVARFLAGFHTRLPPPQLALFGRA